MKQARAERVVTAIGRSSSAWRSGPSLPWFIGRGTIDILVFSGLYTIAGLGVSFLLGQCGIVSLAQSGFYGIGAYATAYGTTVLGLPIPVCIVMGIIVSGLIAAAVGIPVLRLVGLFSRPCHARARHHRPCPVPGTGMAYWRHARHRRHPADFAVRFCDQHAVPFLLPGLALRLRCYPSCATISFVHALASPCGRCGTRQTPRRWPASRSNR